MTEEYFGKALREEDYIKYSIDNVYPSRSLTKDESVFMTWLARFTMFLDKSLFFQINNLQRHTELVLSGKRATRYEFPKTEVLDKEIEELEKITNKEYKKIYIIGGGARNAFLDHLVKVYTNKKVIALPIEATALGNIKVQMKASKEL